jgi:uncharacterized membrane protein YeaQ/YmgE (transglycosylase-associated protein family)
MNCLSIHSSGKLALPSILLASLLVGLLPLTAHGGTAVTAPAPSLDEVANWKDHTVTPVSDPIFFEDAIIRTEIRPVMGTQRIGDDFFSRGGNLQVYGIQLRYAVTDRLAIFMNKGGYDDVHPNVGPHIDGWANLAGGLKYAIIDDKADAFILTPGVTFEIPNGDNEIFQGKGNGVWNFFLSTEKGFGDFHVLANAGFVIPNDTNADSTLFHYHVQFDYYACRYFKPFVVMNGYTVLKAGNYVPLTTEGYDLVNFGSSLSDGTTQITLGGGFRSNIWSVMVSRKLAAFRERFILTLHLMIHILWSIIVGFIVGLIARAVYPGAQGLGFWLTTALGVGGSFVGGLLGMMFSKPQPGAKFHPAGFFLSIVGALILLFVYTKFVH